MTEIERAKRAMEEMAGRLADDGVYSYKLADIMMDLPEAAMSEATCEYAACMDAEHVSYMPAELVTRKVLMSAIRSGSGSIKKIPARHMTEELYEEYVRAYADISLVPKRFLESPRIYCCALRRDVAQAAHLTPLVAASEEASLALLEGIESGMSVKRVLLEPVAPGLSTALRMLFERHGSSPHVRTWLLREAHLSDSATAWSEDTMRSYWSFISFHLRELSSGNPDGVDHHSVHMSALLSALVLMSQWEATDVLGLMEREHCLFEHVTKSPFYEGSKLSKIISSDYSHISEVGEAL